MTSHCRIFPIYLGRYMWHLRFSAKTAVDWMFTRPGFTPVSELLTQMDVQSISRLAFPPLQKACRNWLTGLPNTTVTMFAWNPPVSSGYRCSISLKRPAGLPWRIPNTQNHKKETRQTVRMPSGFATCICVIWSSPALFLRRIFASCVT